MAKEGQKKRRSFMQRASQDSMTGHQIAAGAAARATAGDGYPS